MVTTQREKRARQALKLLGHDRCTAFIRAIREDRHCIAVKLLNEQLDAGTDLDTIFFTGEEFGFQLSAAPIGPDRFRIEFSCRAGPLAGDGGAWDVLFDADGSASEATGVDEWIY
jgi:hypothetical protein